MDEAKSGKDGEMGMEDLDGRVSISWLYCTLQAVKYKTNLRSVGALFRSHLNGPASARVQVVDGLREQSFELLGFRRRGLAGQVRHEV